jgi:SnoaL-like domain
MAKGVLETGSRKPMERSAELEILTRNLYEAVSKSDVSFFERHLAQRESCIVIGTARDEWWNDYRSALDAIRKQMEAVGDAVTLSAGEVHAYRQGDVGWVADRPMFRLGSTEVVCRHTSVFVREEGDWRIVQHHFSIGVANEDVFGKDAGRFARFPE